MLGMRALGRQGVPGPGPCIVEQPPPTLQHLALPRYQVRRYEPVRTSPATPGHLQACTPVPLYLCPPASPVWYFGQQQEKHTTHPHPLTPAGTSHRSPPASTSEPVPIFPSPSSSRLGQCFSFLPQSCQSILMWSYVLYHRLINSPPLRSARKKFWTVPYC